MPRAVAEKTDPGRRHLHNSGASLVLASSPAGWAVLTGSWYQSAAVDGDRHAVVYLVWVVPTMVVTWILPDDPALDEGAPAYQ